MSEGEGLGVSERRFTSEDLRIVGVGVSEGLGV